MIGGHADALAAVLDVFEYQLRLKRTVFTIGIGVRAIGYPIEPLRESYGFHGG